MTIYLDLAVDRTQAYIARTDKLRARRGASAMLIDAFNTLKAPDGWVLNDEAPEIDGKVSFKTSESADPQPAARLMISTLRQSLPAAEFHAAWFQGDTYAGAYVSDDVSNRYESGPPTSDWPLARPCDRCGIDPAIDFVRKPTRERVCADCLARELFGGNESPHEAQLRDQVGATELALELSDLAFLGPESHKNNHLATVYIDGNKLGSTFRRLAEVGGDTSKFARTVSSATSEALRDATKAVCDRLDSTEMLPVTPHIVGGDDVLVSMPAAMWVPFTRTYLTSFAERASGGGDGVAVTACAGVAIAHHKHPFVDCLEVAEELLSAAKSSVAGNDSAVAWADLTASSHDELREHDPITTAWIDEHEHDLTKLATADKSARSSLGLAAAEGIERLREQNARNEVPGAAPFINDRARMAAALSLTSWWVQ